MSRAELLIIANEIGLDVAGLTRQEMTELIRAKTLKMFDKKGKNIGASNMSLTLKRFLYYEHCFIFRNKEGELVDYKGEPLPRSKRNK